MDREADGDGFGERDPLANRRKHLLAGAACQATKNWWKTTPASTRLRGSPPLGVKGVAAIVPFDVPPLWAGLAAHLTQVFASLVEGGLKSAAG